MALPAQHVIVYENAQGETTPYTTAYTDKQMTDATMRCHYGVEGATNIRALPADVVYAALHGAA